MLSIRSLRDHVTHVTAKKTTVTNLDAEWRTGEQEGGERNYGGLYARIRPRKGFRKKLRAWFALFSILFFVFNCICAFY